MTAALDTDTGLVDDPFGHGEVVGAHDLPAASARLLAGYVLTSSTMRSRVRAYVADAWHGLGTWGDSAVDEFASLVAPMLDAARQQTAEMTAAYLAAQKTLVTAHRLTLDPGPSVAISGSPRGVSDATLLRRPFVTTWTALSRGKSLDQAVAMGATRADKITATDLQLAKTSTARDMLTGDEQVVGYRRVLTGNESCARCVLASTQRYHRGVLMPIHPGCDCGVAPIYGTEDPGQVIDDVTLEKMHQVVADDLGAAYVDRGGRSPADYRKLIVTHQHGEIGPLIGIRGQGFAGPAVVPGHGGPDHKIDIPEPRAPEPPKVFHGEVADHVTKMKSLDARHQTAVDAALVAIGKVHHDGGLPPVKMSGSKRLGRGVHGDFVDAGTFSTVENPGGKDPKIRLSATLGSDHTVFTAVHELGHYIDREALAPSDFGFGTTSITRDDMMRQTPMARLVMALMESHTIQLVSDVADNDSRAAARDFAKYLTDPREMFARAYAQYVATRSKDPAMLRSLEGDREQDGRFLPRQWPDKEFGPIAEAFDAVFAEKGWR